MAVKVDLTEYKRSEETIERLAFRDVLTDLPNRALFKDRLHQALTAAQRSGDKLAVAVLDLDRFKLVNDTLGDVCGDLLLKSVASRLSDALREEDTIARAGGDDFLVLLPKITSTEHLSIVADKVMEQFRSPWDIMGESAYVTASIGFAVYPADGEMAQTLIECADTAMRRAKSSGGNAYQFYEASLEMRASERLQTESELHRALDAGEFVLYYQPQIDLSTGKITGVEALVRWQHPKRGLVPPLEFISLAEETGLIVPLGEWIISDACRQAALWQTLAGAPLLMAVNLSPRQFRQRDLSETIAAALSTTGLEPQLLELEVTENLAMEDVKLTDAILRDLGEIGVRSALDDFGTGYSSLSYLSSLPLSTVKIDRSFISGAGTKRASAAIVKAVVALGHELDLTVLAEGVETKAQMRMVKVQECDLAQGFLFSRPLPVDELTSVLTTGKSLPPSAQN